MPAASGKFGSANLIANTDADLYACPAATTATVNITLCNRNASDATSVRISIGAAVPAAEDYIEYDVSVPANGVLVRTQEVVGAGEHIVVRSSLGSVSARVSGFEEAA